MDLVSFAKNENYLPFVYVAIFFGMSIEAMLTLLAVVFLVVNGALNPLLALLVIIIGGLCEQFIWYYVGYHLNYFKKIISLVQKLTNRYDNHFLEHPRRVLILSKFIYGLHRSALVKFGTLKFPLKRYFSYGFEAIIFWLITVGSIGYAFSASYVELKKYIQYAEIIPFVILIVFLFGEYFVSKKLRRKL